MKNNQNLIIKKLVSAFLIIVLILVIGLISILFVSFYSVNSNERVIQLRDNEIYRVVGEGTYFYNPFTDSVKRIDINSRTKAINNISAYTKDQQQLFIDLNLNFRISAEELDQGYLDFETLKEKFSRLCDDKIPSQVRKSLLKYNYDEIIHDKSKLNDDINHSLIRPIEGGAIIIESIEVNYLKKKVVLNDFRK